MQSDTKLYLVLDFVKGGELFTRLDHVRLRIARRWLSSVIAYAHI
jgi:hypothetical protein